MKIISTPEQILLLSEGKTEENERFAIFLQSQEASFVDALVFRLNAYITPQIDCLKCGNCCRSLMVQVEEEEIVHLSSTLGIKTEKFYDNYIEKGTGTMMLLNRIPCHFLSGNKCTIYLDRFSACQEFPGLHIPAFTSRLFTVFMHYSRCPIIFNVIESLKEHFSSSLKQEE